MKFSLYCAIGTFAMFYFATFSGAQEQKPADPDVVKKLRLNQLKELCKQRAMTHIIEFMVAYRPDIDGDCIEEYENLIKEIHKESLAIAKETPQRQYMSWPRIQHGGPFTKLQDAGERSTLLLESFPDDKVELHRQIIVSSKQVVLKRLWQELIIATNASECQIDGIDQSIVICSGDINLANGPSGRNLLICGGSVVGDGRKASGQVIVAGVPLEMKSNWARLMITLDDKRWSKSIRFYSIAEDGFVAKLEKKQVIVTEVKEKSLFLDWKLAKGDVIEKINGYPVNTLTELNRLIVRAKVTNGELIANVLRGEEKLVQKITIPSLEPVKK